MYWYIPCFAIQKEESGLVRKRACFCMPAGNWKNCIFLLRLICMGWYRLSVYRRIAVMKSGSVLPQDYIAIRKEHRLPGNTIRWKTVCQTTLFIIYWKMNGGVYGWQLTRDWLALIRRRVLSSTIRSRTDCLTISLTISELAKRTMVHSSWGLLGALPISSHTNWVIIHIPRMR